MTVYMRARIFRIQFLAFMFVDCDCLLGVRVWFPIHVWILILLLNETSSFLFLFFGCFFPLVNQWDYSVGFLCRNFWYCLRDSSKSGLDRILA